MGKAGKRRSTMPVYILAILLLYLYFCYLLVHGLPMLRSTSRHVRSRAVAEMVTMHIFFAATIVCLLLACCVEPGTVPHEQPWDPAVHSSGDMSTREKKGDGRLRFCRTCGTYKPDRTHHDSQTGRCVLEMDHYCPWIYNCVGFHNRKYFILLLLNASTSLIAYCIFAVDTVRDAANMRLELSTAFNALMSFFVAALLGIVVTSFFFFHCWLVANNYTTVEFCEKRLSKRRLESGVEVRSYYETSLYDVGFFQNVSQVIGHNPLLWFIPTNLGRSGNGLEFDADPSHPLSQASESPRREKSSDRSQV